MEKAYQSLSLFDFQQRFSTEDQRLAYLSSGKWENGYVCSKCGHTHCCKGASPCSRQSTRCRHTESATAGTLFHKVKFPLLKAFYIVYLVSTSKNGISSTGLSRKLKLRQKTCRFFKRKVMKAMESSGRYPLKDHVDVDEFFVGGQEAGKKGGGKENKKRVVLAIEKRGRGISRMYGFAPFFLQKQQCFQTVSCRFRTFTHKIPTFARYRIARRQIIH